MLGEDNETGKRGRGRDIEDERERVYEVDTTMTTTSSLSSYLLSSTNLERRRGIAIACLLRFG